MLFSDVGDVIDLVAVAVSVSITTSRTPGRSAMTARSHATPSSESSHPSPSGPSLALTTRNLSAPAASSLCHTLVLASSSTAQSTT